MRILQEEFCRREGKAQAKQTENKKHKKAKLATTLVAVLVLDLAPHF